MSTQFLSVEEFRIWVGLGRSSAYDLLRRQEIVGVRFGKVVRIPKAALHTYLGMDRKESSQNSNN